MNKKGFLLAEETLKIVIAVISITFLVYLLASLYLNNQDENDLELAKSSLNHLIDEMNVGIVEVEIFNPDGWNLISWNTGEEIPLQCSNLEWSSCLCICDDSWFGSGLEDCNDLGICKENPDLFVVGVNSPSPIEIKSPSIKLNIDYENKKITLK
ncbi:MAG: hypothetical protein Q8O84_05220 [Nanoarchaeota archaeon]|nr:hypothetical protein [Nanoarchaeota archaeon]